MIIFDSDTSGSESDDEDIQEETPVSSKTDTDANVTDASGLQGTLIKQTRGLTKIGEVGDFLTLVSTQSP